MEDTMDKLLEEETEHNLTESTPSIDLTSQISHEKLQEMLTNTVLDILKKNNNNLTSNNINEQGENQLHEATEKGKDQMTDSVESDEILADICQEYKTGDEKGPPINEKLCKILQDLIWGVYKKEKLDQILKENIPPSNLKNLDIPPVNIEIWSRMNHNAKTNDLRLQSIQGLLLKSLITNARLASFLYESRNLTDSKEIIRKSLKICANSALILGKANLDISNLRREKIGPELNQNYRHMVNKENNSGEQPAKQLFGDDLQKFLKEVTENKNLGQSIANTAKSSNSSSTISVNPDNNKPNSFLYRGKVSRGKHKTYHPYKRQNHQSSHQQRYQQNQSQQNNHR